LLIRAAADHLDAVVQSEALGCNLRFCHGHKFRIASGQDMPVIAPVQLTAACLSSASVYKSEDAVAACTTCWQSSKYVKQDGRQLQELSRKRKADKIEAAVDYAALYHDLHGKLAKHFGVECAPASEIRRLKEQVDRQVALG
jgi:Zn finger protein HypA/HybF involved in hydrogenase expression